MNTLLPLTAALWLLVLLIAARQAVCAPRNRPYEPIAWDAMVWIAAGGLALVSAFFF